MNGKIIATILALGMVVSAFAMMAVPAKAASANNVWFIDIDDGSGTLLPAPDSQSANGGSVRMFAFDTPAEVNTGVSLTGGSPYPGSSDVIGLEGAAGGPEMAKLDTFAFATQWSVGESFVGLVEVDATPVAGDVDVYIDGGVFKNTVPHGYACAFRWNIIGTGDDYGPVYQDDYPLEEMPAPTITASPSITWAGMTGGSQDGPTTTAGQILSWQLYEATASNGPWTQVGTAAYGAAITYSVVDNSWYSVRMTWVGNVASLVMSEPIQKLGFANAAPVAGSVVTAPNPHNGNIVSEQVTITATITDADAANTLTAEYSVNGGTTWTAFAQTGVSPLNVNAVYAFPNGYTEGAHGILVRGYDGTVNSANAAGSIVVTDTTAPVVTQNTVPGATVYAGQNSFISIGYGDFRPYNTAIGSSYFRYRVNAGAWQTSTWTNASFVWGSYTNTLTASIPGALLVAGDVVDYNGQVTATSATPQTTAWAGGSFTVLAAPLGVQFPFVVYGRVSLYAGNAGAYTPILSTGGGIVTASWWSTFTNAVATRTDTVNALGQFSIDLLNYTDGSNVMLTTTFDAPYLNAGTNYTTIVAAAGSVQQNVLCGVPYSVTITAPIALSNQQSGVAFPTTYVIRDRAGLLARGYYSFADGPMIWTSSDVAFVPPAAYTFNGIADGGTHNVPTLTLFSGGVQWIQVAETTLDQYPTPWDNFQVQTGFGAGGVPVYAAGWLDDWDRISVNVLAGGFDWNVVVGWNIVSVPQDPVNEGLIAGFDAFDALNYCHWQLAGVTDLSLANKNGAVYDMFDYGQPEAAAFAMDGVHGYWVYSNVAGVCHFNSTNWTAGLNTVVAAAGWNLLGFTHNFIPWTVTPTAAMFTTGVIDVDLSIAGPLTKIVATEWLELAAPQWYHSYVVTDTFPGMATHNWAWDFSYSTQPGNGYFLWVDAATTITFPLAY